MGELLSESRQSWALKHCTYLNTQCPSTEAQASSVMPCTPVRCLAAMGKSQQANTCILTYGQMAAAQGQKSQLHFLSTACQPCGIITCIRPEPAAIKELQVRCESDIWRWLTTGRPTSQRVSISPCIYKSGHKPGQQTAAESKDLTDPEQHTIVSMNSTQ